MGGSHPSSLEINQTLETTIVRCKKCTESGNLEIMCDPFDKIILEKSKPDYISIYSNLKVCGTYSFYVLATIYSNSVHRKIISIGEPKIHKINEIIIGVLCLKLEDIEDYHELLIGKIGNHRILISNREIRGITVGKMYDISYKKFWKTNHYKVTNITSK